jgi:hypothetical protein
VLFTESPEDIFHPLPPCGRFAFSDACAHGLNLLMHVVRNLVCMKILNTCDLEVRNTCRRFGTRAVTRDMTSSTVLLTFSALLLAWSSWGPVVGVCALPSTTVVGYFTCSAYTTTSEYDQVIVMDPALVELRAGCFINRLLLLRSGGSQSVPIDGLKLLIDSATLNQSIAIKCQLQRANITITRTAIGCISPPPLNSTGQLPNATAYTTDDFASTPAVASASGRWRPVATDSAVSQPVVFSESVTDSSIRVLGSCVATDDGGTAEAGTALLRGAIVFSGTTLERSTIQVSDSVVQATARLLSGSTGLHILPATRNVTIIVVRSVFAGRCDGGGGQPPFRDPWQAESRLVHVLHASTGTEVALRSSSLVVVGSDVRTLKPVDVVVEQSAALSDDRVAAADALALVGSEALTVDAVAAAATVVTVHIDGSRLDVVSSVTNASYASSVTWSGIRITNAPGLEFVIGNSSFFRMRSCGSGTLISVNEATTSQLLSLGGPLPFRLSRVQVQDCTFQVTVNDARDVCAVALHGITRKSVVTIARSSITVTARPGLSATAPPRGAADGLRFSCGQLISSPSTPTEYDSEHAVITIDTLTLIIAANATLHNSTRALFLGSRAWKLTEWTIAGSSITQSFAANNNSASASAWFDGPVHNSTLSVTSTTMSGFGSGVMWAGGGSNSTTVYLNTVTFGSPLTSTKAWVTSGAAWNITNATHTKYFISQCVRVGLTNFVPSGTTTEVACGKCVIWQHCNEQYTIASPVIAGKCTCDCSKAVTSNFRVDSRCTPYSTFTNTIGTETKSRGTVTRTKPYVSHTFVTRTNLASSTPTSTTTRSAPATATAFGNSTTRSSSLSLPHNTKTMALTTSTSLTHHTSSESRHRVSPTLRESNSRTRSNSLRSTATRTYPGSATISATYVAPGPPYLTPLEEALVAIGFSRMTAKGLEGAVCVAAALTGLVSPVQGGKGLSIAANARILHCEYNAHRPELVEPKLPWWRVVVPFGLGSAPLGYVRAAIVVSALLVAVIDTVLVTVMLRLPFWIRLRVLIGAVAVLFHGYFLPTAALASGLVFSRGTEAADIAVAALGIVSTAVLASLPAVALTFMPSLYLAFRLFDRNARRYDQWWVRFYIIEDSLVTCAASVLLGIMPGDHVACSSIGLAVCALWVGHVVYLLVTRPIQRRVTLVFAIVVGFLQLMVCAAAAATALDANALPAVGWLTVVQMSFLLLLLPVMMYWRFAVTQRRKFRARDEGDPTLLSRTVDGIAIADSAGHVGFLEAERLATEARFGPDPAAADRKSQHQRRIEKELKRKEAIERALLDERDKQLKSIAGQFAALTFESPHKSIGKDSETLKVVAAAFGPAASPRNLSRVQNHFPTVDVEMVVLEAARNAASRKATSGVLLHPDDAPLVNPLSRAGRANPLLHAAPSSTRATLRSPSTARCPPLPPPPPPPPNLRVRDASSSPTSKRRPRDPFAVGRETVATPPRSNAKGEISPPGVSRVEPQVDDLNTML